MHVNYLDTFLAFLGMTFGGISALPELFFQRHPDADHNAGTGVRHAGDGRR